MIKQISICFFLLSIVFIIIISGCEEEVTKPENNNPVIRSLTAFPNPVHLSDSFIVYCDAYEMDGDSLFYDWFCTSGVSIKGAHPTMPFGLYHQKVNSMIFYAPDSMINQNDSTRIFCDVRDGKGGGTSAWIFVKIIGGISEGLLINK